MSCSTSLVPVRLWHAGTLPAPPNPARIRRLIWRHPYAIRRRWSCVPGSNYYFKLRYEFYLNILALFSSQALQMSTSTRQRGSLSATDRRVATPPPSREVVDFIPPSLTEQNGVWDDSLKTKQKKTYPKQKQKILSPPGDNERRIGAAADPVHGAVESSFKPSAARRECGIHKGYRKHLQLRLKLLDPKDYFFFFLIFILLDGVHCFSILHVLMDALQFVIRLHVDIFSSAPFAVLLLENAKSTCQSLCNQITVLSPFFYSMCHLDFGFFP